MGTEARSIEPALEVLPEVLEAVLEPEALDKAVRTFTGNIL